MTSDVVVGVEWSFPEGSDLVGVKKEVSFWSRDEKHDKLINTALRSLVEATSYRFAQS